MVGEHRADYASGMGGADVDRPTIAMAAANLQYSDAVGREKLRCVPWPHLLRLPMMSQFNKDRELTCGRC